MDRVIEICTTIGVALMFIGIMGTLLGFMISPLMMDIFLVVAAVGAVLIAGSLFIDLLRTPQEDGYTFGKEK